MFPPYGEGYVMSNSAENRRRGIRLKEYDYSQPGAYFITVCAYKRSRIFGEIADGEMKLNRYGEIVMECWHNLPNYEPHTELDAFVIMPNHVHGIVVIRDVEVVTKRHPLSQIVRIFKTSSSRRINGVRNTGGVPVWQRSYWEHVIRDQDALNRIRNYILTNPGRWHLDRENSERIREDDFDRWLIDEGKKELP